MTDLRNPYQPGRLDLPVGAGPVPFKPGNGRIQVGEALREAREAFKKHWVLGTVATLAVQFISFGISLIGQVFQAASAFLGSEWMAVGIGLTGLLSLAISPAIAAGPIYLALQARDSMRKPSVTVAFEQVLVGFRRFWSIQGLYWLIMAIVLVPLLLVGGAIAGYFYFANGFARTPTPPEILLAIAAATPGIVAVMYLSFRLFFAFFLCLDQHTGPVESIRRSWALSSGHLPEILGLAFSLLGLFLLALIPWLIVSILTCGVGFLAIFSLTFFYGLANAAAYRMLLPLEGEDSTSGIASEDAPAAAPGADTDPYA